MNLTHLHTHLALLLALAIAGIGFMTAGCGQPVEAAARYEADALVEAMDAHFAEPRQRRRELLDDPAELDQVLARGAEKARERATAVRDRAYRACGLR